MQQIQSSGGSAQKKTLALFPQLEAKFLLAQRENKNERLALSGISEEIYSLFLCSIVERHKNLSHLVVCRDSAQAEIFLQNARAILGEQVYFFPGLESSPYQTTLQSESDLISRLEVLSAIAEKKTPLLIVASIEGAMLKGPPLSFFKENSLRLEVSDVVSPFELAQKLNAIGYRREGAAEEAGSFAIKGEIFDIAPFSSERRSELKGHRLHYFDEMIEIIKGIDSRGRTLADRVFEKIDLFPGPGAVLQDKYRLFFRENLPRHSLAFREKLEKRKSILTSLREGRFFENYVAYFPLFFSKSQSLLEICRDQSICEHVFDSSSTENGYFRFLDELREDFELLEKAQGAKLILPPPSSLYDGADLLWKEGHQVLVDQLRKDQFFEKQGESGASEVPIHTEAASSYLIGEDSKSENLALLKTKNLLNEVASGKTVLFLCSNDSAKRELKNLIETLSDGAFSPQIHFYSQQALSSYGLFFPNEKLFVLSERDIFGRKIRSNTPSEKTEKFDLDLFAEQLSTLNEGDYVIHSDFGAGKYRGLRSMEAEKGGGDFLEIEYAAGDKVYVPVYKLNLIQKHADATSNLPLENLRNNKFAEKKSKARASAKRLAFDLLELNARREAATAYSFSPPDEIYQQFEDEFRFEETPDQAKAINAVVEKMQSPKPMDFLVCGDVGFGKTEIAMRAAALAVFDNKQVIVLVPTTILALQHYQSFCERFKNFAVNINFLSRLKSPKEVREIKSKLSSGEIDIIIGTHRLLASDLNYADLGLVIVDEEHRFGVEHKEKLKNMKSNLDFLTLTATPIPRSLQLAYLGLKDLVLIKTPPPRRQSIKTYISGEDPITLQSAIEKELARGGQAFIIHNRVKDIDNYQAFIKELVPHAKIVQAHGQMPEKELEKKINAFYQGEYQVLLATTIVESGIDIPNANTLIVDRAHTFGLAQLHQLRGRIGRSDRKAYAYFIVPDFHNMSPDAERRLKALSTFADVGQGFSIASSDLEIRGPGEILGAEQSGHIETIGLELYLSLLKEAVNELKGGTELDLKARKVEVNVPIPSLIPLDYIKDSRERLRSYKRLSNAGSEEILQNLEEEIVDRFGHPPHEFSNLVAILRCRLLFSALPLKSAAVTGPSCVLQFDQKALQTLPLVQEKLSRHLISQSNQYQLSPDFKASYRFQNSEERARPLEVLERIAREFSALL